MVPKILTLTNRGLSLSLWTLPMEPEVFTLDPALDVYTRALRPHPESLDATLEHCRLNLELWRQTPELYDNFIASILNHHGS